MDAAEFGRAQARDGSCALQVGSLDATSRALLARLYREDFARFGYATEVGASRVAIANNASAGGGAADFLAPAPKPSSPDAVPWPHAITESSAESTLWFWPQAKAWTCGGGGGGATRGIRSVHARHVKSEGRGRREREAGW